MSLDCRVRADLCGKKVAASDADRPRNTEYVVIDAAATPEPIAKINSAVSPVDTILIGV